jgi:deoxyribonuclease-4
VNLAGTEPRFHEQSIDVLASDLRAGAAFDARYVNAHVGSHLGSGPERAVEQVVSAIGAAFAATTDVVDRPMLVLENSAGGGNGYGATIPELASLFHGLDERRIGRASVGLCLDTAHLWGAGYDLRDATVVDDLFGELEATIGLDRFVMVHLNDSRSELGSRSDRHEHVGAGRIGEPGLGTFLHHGAVRRVTAYLETPGMEEGYDKLNLERARDLLAGRSLEALPPEAFDLPPRHRPRRTPVPQTTS